MGYEGIDPTMRPFYTFSWTDDFLVPFETFDAVSTWHITPNLTSTPASTPAMRSARGWITTGPLRAISASA